MAVSRRSFLKTTFSATLAFTLPTWLIPHPLAEAGKKIREFDLSASKARIHLGAGPEFWAFTYNGQVPGPEIRVNEGEVIRVILKNYLPEGTSIHWHGVPVPNAMDGVPGVTQEDVRPGETFVYEFEARPAGTYLYHSHSRYQLDQGLYGVLIIEPANESRSHDREYTLTLEDWVMKDGGGVAATARRPPMGMMHGMMGRGGGPVAEAAPLLEPVYGAYAINGKVYPAGEPLRITKGDRFKLRLCNSSSATIYDLRLAGHQLTITHADGNPVKPIATDVLRIGMGERYDVEFVANNPGHWFLSAMERGLGEGLLRIPINYKGIRTKEPTPPRFHRGLRFASYWDLQSLHTHNMLPPDHADKFFLQTLSGAMHSPNWTINGQVYPNTQPLVVKRVEWVRIGYWNHSMMPHPMHLHGHFFRVVNRGLPPDNWILKDTINVNPMERIEIDFLADNPGKWFHHCHNLYHMMAGMANVVAYRGS